MFDRQLLSEGLTLAHVCCLLAVLTWGFWRLWQDKGLFLSVVFTALWADLVLTALVLSEFGTLGSRYAYVTLSVALGVALSVLARHLQNQRPTSLLDRSTTVRLSRSERVLNGILWAAIGLAVVPTTMLCIGYDPNNYDSIAYRLPRVFLYIAQGSVSHIPIGDIRAQLYPFDSALVYLGIAIHGLAPRWMNLFGFVTWLVGGIAVARTARECNASPTAGLFAATLYLTAPAVLVSASSGNDDLMAGVPALIAFLFAIRWWKFGGSTEAVLAATGIGLSAGSKLHLPFMLPAILVFGTVMALQFALAAKPKSIPRIRVLQPILLSCIIAVFSLPALIINVVATGRVTPLIPNFQNSPFDVKIAFINTMINSASLFLAPIADLDVNSVTAHRKYMFDAFNLFSKNVIFSWLPTDLDFSNTPFYTFQGIASNDGYLGVWEQSAWLGFVPWLLALVFVFALPGCLFKRERRMPSLRFLAFWFSAAFFGWHLARCFSIKYVSGAGIYYAFIIVITAPGLAWLWDADDVGRRLRLLFRVGCMVVLGTNLVSAANEFSFNYQRNIPDLVRADHFDPRPSNVDPALRADLQGSLHTLIAYTEWELPLFDLMGVQPKARYALTDALPAAAVPGFGLDLLLERTRTEFGEITLQFAQDDRERLKLLGTVMSSYGEQRSFGHESKTSDKDSNIVASYRAGDEGQGIVLDSGWSVSERTHRWSIGPQSALTFSLPDGMVSCRLDMRAATAGAQRVSLAANGDPVGSVLLDSWFPGVSSSVALPDAVMVPGQSNRVTLDYDHPHASSTDARELALALVDATVTCQHALSNSVPRNRKRIFSYDAAQGGEEMIFGQGWSPSERTHRWSDGPASDISFHVPRASTDCSLQATGITAGPETIMPSLNGHSLPPLQLQSWFPGSPFQIALPDEAMREDADNTLTIRYDRTENVGGRHLALGVIKASLGCRRAAAAVAGELPPLNPHGFAVLGLDQRRDAANGVQSVTISRLNGVGPDEAFTASVSLIAPSGEVVFRGPTKLQPVGQAFDLPGAPQDGFLKITLARVDRPTTEAVAYVPIKYGATLPLDLRALPDGSRP